jgi:hypothetical protein
VGGLFSLETISFVEHSAFLKGAYRKKERETHDKVHKDKID